MSEARLSGQSPSARRILALHFPLWAIDCLRRADPELAADPRPLALYEREGNGLRLVAVDPTAHAARLRQGMALADAQALCPHGLFLPLDPDRVQARFAALADWHGYVSPIVSIHTAVVPFGDLVIDIAGTEHLWGGAEALLHGVTGRLAAMGIAVQGAIAPSLGAAWALARYAPAQVVAEHQLARALGPLPVMALRIGERMAVELARLGLRTVGQIDGRNRRALAARFGGEVLLRLDQALGAVAERMVPRFAPPDFHAAQKFAEPLASIAPLLEIAAGLAGAVCAQLRNAEAGAQEFVLTLFRVDHCVLTLSVRAAQATRDPAHIARLFANRIDTLRSDFDAGFGIEMMRLGAGLVSALPGGQTSAFAGTAAQAGLDRLYDRLMSRLGAQAVTVARLENRFMPEHAVRLASIAAPGAVADLPPAVLGPRPVRLLPAPELLEVVAEVPEGPPASMVWRKLSHTLVKAAGPERISPEWWRGQGPGLTRDYYSVEDAEGRGFWLFREGFYGAAEAPRWFLHGVF